MSTGPHLVTEQTPATGPLCATLLAAGIGCCSLGLLTLFGALSKPFSGWLGFYKPSGALSGVAILTVLLWILSWILLTKLWQGKSPRQSAVLTTAFLLLLVGLLTTFPPFLHLFVRG